MAAGHGGARRNGGWSSVSVETVSLYRYVEKIELAGAPHELGYLAEAAGGLLAGVRTYADRVFRRIVCAAVHIIKL